MTRLIGPLIEAWDELRIHKVRILLALIAVTIAVCALTVAVALGQMITTISKATMEQQAGRPATYHVDIWPNSASPIDNDKLSETYKTFVERYDIKYYSRVMQTQVNVRTPNGVLPVQTAVIDPGYGKMKLLTVDQGRTLTEADSLNLAPSVVINKAMWQALGSPPLSSHPTMKLLGANPTTAVIVGIKDIFMWEGETATMMMLYDNFQAIDPGTSNPWGGNQVSLEFWVPPDQADTVESIINRDLMKAIPGAQVNFYRMDYSGMEDWIRPQRIGVIGAASLLLLLGAMGLLNLSLVTVKARVREIGIRRSFGATASRVFFAVMLESLVATAIAGAVGVVAAAAITQKIPMGWLTQGGPPVPLPPFPIGAALVGIGAATAVGAIAGAIPAVMATRVRVIDAIRY